MGVCVGDDILENLGTVVGEHLQRTLHFVAPRRRAAEVALRQVFVKILPRQFGKTIGHIEHSLAPRQTGEGAGDVAQPLAALFKALQGPFHVGAYGV